MVDHARKVIRPDSWPANHRAALAVFVDTDQVEGLNTPPDVLRAMNQRLLDMLADLAIEPTVIVDADADAPFSLQSDSEVDLAVRHSTNGADFKEVKARCTDRFGSTLTGIVALDGSLSLPQADLQVWLIDGSGGTLPLATENGGIIIPYSPWWHDVKWFSATAPHPPSALLESWSASLTSVRSHGELMAIVISGQASGHPGHLESVQRFLDEAIAAGDVWITNGAGLAGWARQSISR